jgi:putative toxin-antitoxin system antitoxin component (TIGR02293 family)
MSSESLGVPNTASMLGLKADDVHRVHDRILQGFPFSVLTRFEKDSRLAKNAIHTVMSLPSRTLARRKEAGRLSAEESERLFRLAHLFRQAVELFAGDEEAAREWMQAPRPALGGRAPLELARTEVGARQVETLIHQLGHGVYV